MCLTKFPNTNENSHCEATCIDISETRGKYRPTDHCTITVVAFAFVQVKAAKVGIEQARACIDTVPEAKKKDC